MKTIEEQLTSALHRRDAELIVNGQLDAIINDDDVVRWAPQQNTHRRRPLLLTVAAVAVLVVGAGGLIWAQRTEPVPSAAAADTSASADPATQLFVLPSNHGDLELSGGEVFATLDEGGMSPAATPMMLVGTEVDGGFTDLVDVRVFDEMPDGFVGVGVSEVATPTGPALVSTDGFPVLAVVQKRGDDWLLLLGASEERDLIDLISRVSIDSSGSPTIESERHVVIEEVSRDETAVDLAQGIYSTSYDVTDPASGITFEVETATAPSAALLGMYTLNPIRSTTVNGTAAWILTRDEESVGGTSVGVAWRASPNRVVAVGAQASLDQVHAMAERLEQVTEEDWLAALPGATITD